MCAVLSRQRINWRKGESLASQLAPALLLCLPIACTTTGTGSGEISAPGKSPTSVRLTWTSKDAGITGTIVGEASHENTGEAKCDVLGVIDQSVERKR